MQRIQQYTDKKGFTLAEVLVTLVIIGVIAALTIPALIQNVQDAQLRTAWKASYSIINQATGRMLVDNGGSFMNYFQSSADMRDKYANYLISTIKCGNNVLGNCFPNVGDVKYLSGYVLTSGDMTNSFGLPGSTGLVLNDGLSIIVGRYPACPPQSDNRNYCGWMVVDVNGLKSPNTVGKDIFRIWVLDTGIIPQGAQGFYYPSDCLSTGSGFGCGALYLQQ